ncbi:AlpA family transcriptional regulator [Serratia fonticola]|uniref:AlpA family transcriptional regulator n=1 Tax=Serratia fonticola TaxID=47917 RepID=A0A542BHA0_SERFO|nr:AlpA family phage regulatory protein [Serratia fonticola]TQI77968.1 AlpA family transcriptional regulator [Serratia fonticola]TQI95035.1 AlpA family transcriptional regulator [Serratia fonticola]TVZ69533.1 AlpA family transcriptional regulator [Serratia fonticola]
MNTQDFTFPLSGNARAAAVARFLSVSEATVWRYAKRPGFPKPVKLSDRATVFDAAAVRQWLESRKQGGRHA